MLCMYDVSVFVMCPIKSLNTSVKGQEIYGDEKLVNKTLCETHTMTAGILLSHETGHSGLQPVPWSS